LNGYVVGAKKKEGPESDLSGVEEKSPLEKRTMEGIATLRKAKRLHKTSKGSSKKKPGDRLNLKA